MLHHRYANVINLFIMLLVKDIWKETLSVYRFPNFHPQHNVVKIVREKYLHTTAFTDKEKLQNFLSELYVFLVDQMHISLNKVWNKCYLTTVYKSVCSLLIIVSYWCGHENIPR